MTKNKQKKMFSALVVIVCLACMISGTLAYFTAEEKADNVITSGGVDIQLQELKQNEDGTFEQFQDVIGVMPGASVSKIVQVMNTGFGDAYVRVKVEKSITLADGSQASAADVNAYLSMDFDTANWIYSEQDGEGWWYYNADDNFGHPGILSPTQTTLPLFKNVAFDASMPNEYQGSTATITVTVQAVQSAHNPDDSTLGPLAAKGWPAEKLTEIQG